MFEWIRLKSKKKVEDSSYSVATITRGRVIKNENINLDEYDFSSLSKNKSITIKVKRGGNINDFFYVLNRWMVLF
jgi:hypothetical protein